MGPHRLPFLDHFNGVLGARIAGQRKEQSPTLPQPIPTDRLDEALDSVKRLRLELGTTRAEMAAEYVDEARAQFIEALKMLDTSEDRSLHVGLLELVADLDDFRAVLGEGAY